jgi:hypothetical protein
MSIRGQQEGGIMRVLIFSGFAMTLAACASGGGEVGASAARGAENDCVNADWSSIGQRDGLYGEGEAKRLERQGACATFDLAAYEKGRERGLRTYCTPDAGFDAGRNGRDYFGVCGAELEGAFLSEYETGLKLFDLVKRVETLKNARIEAATTLQSDRFELKRALEGYNDAGATSEAKSRAVEEVDRLRRNIDRLEQALPELARDIVSAEKALEDFKRELAKR